MTRLDSENPTKAVFSWSGEYTENDQFVEVSGLFASQLGFQDGDQVLISVHTDRIARCRQVHIEPRSQYDWEEFERYAGEIETNLLSQIRIVWRGMVLPVRLQSNRICLFLTVGEVYPDETEVLLETNTELIRMLPQFSKIDSSAPANLSISSDSSFETKVTPQRSTPGLLTRLFNITGLIESGASSISSNDKAPTCPKVPTMKMLYHIPKFLYLPEPIFRVIPMESLSEQKTAVNTVFISSVYSDSHYPDEKLFVAELIRLLSPNELRSGKDAIKSKANEAEVIATKQAVSTIVRVQLFSGLAAESIGISEGLRRQLAMFTNSRCKLKWNFEMKSNQDRYKESIPDRALLPLATSLTLTPILLPILSQPGHSDETRAKLFRDLKGMVAHQQTLILTQGTLLTFNGKDTIVTLDFEQKQQTPILLVDSSCLSNLELRVLEPLTKKLKTKWNIELPFSSLPELEQKFTSPFVYPLSNDLDDGDGITGFENELNQLASYVNLIFSQNGSISCMPTLIAGPWGSGRSTLLSALVHRIRASGREVYITRIDCRKLRGKRIEPLRKQLVTEFDECSYRQPSLLLLENLDSLLSTTVGVEDKQEQMHLNRCALLVRHLISQSLNCKSLYGCKLAVVATIKSISDLHSWLLPSSGPHLFQQVIKLAPPNAQQRSKILRQMIGRRSTSLKIDCDSIVIDRSFGVSFTDGYLPIDLRLLVDKAIHNSIRQGCDSLQENHFKMAAEKYIPVALRGLQLRSETLVRWNHIGGLSQAKRVLTETLLWPTRYADLFRQLPIRPQSSVLLYGPPGTGKTLLAEALANECSVRFICVRGPELLSKYIGASEAAVRALFQKANQSAPCIIFFDEIDAIAPARGHDSTGVTDRVVNQILTQMDGIEQLQTGVHVVAATSRPDMLDKALLRPGRFDLTLCCPLPDQSERKDILRVLCKRFVVNSEQDGLGVSQAVRIRPTVDFSALAERTDHFSGADLQALLHTAFLESLYDHINSSMNLNVDSAIDPHLLSDNEVDNLVDRLSLLEVDQVHFDRALAQTKPSISRSERLRYKQL